MREKKHLSVIIFSLVSVRSWINLIIINNVDVNSCLCTTRARAIVI